MKKCTFCSEEIQDSAKKCKHCGEWLIEPHEVNTSKISDEVDKKIDNVNIVKEGSSILKQKLKWILKSGGFLLVFGVIMFLVGAKCGTKECTNDTAETIITLVKIFFLIFFYIIGGYLWDLIKLKFKAKS